MRRADLAHILRAASRIVDGHILVIGSQAIHGGVDEELLPELTMLSREADIAFFDDLDESKSDLVDGAIGEMSQFDQTFGYYAQGVSVSTAILPDGWQSRLITFDDPRAGTAQAQCLEPHDLVLSKLAAQREKDRDFAYALMTAGLVDPAVLLQRLGTLPVTGILRARIRRQIDSASARRDA